MLLRRRWSNVVASAGAAVLLASCTGQTQRRPTPEELAEWDREFGTVTLLSIVWELVALAGVAFCVWDILRRRRGDAPSYPWSVPALVLVASGLMLVMTFSFVGLWTA